MGGKLLFIVHLVCMWYVFTNAIIWIPYCLEISHIIFRAWILLTSVCYFLLLVLNWYLYIYNTQFVFTVFTFIYIYIYIYVCMYIGLYKFSKYEILKLKKTYVLKPWGLHLALWEVKKPCLIFSLKTMAQIQGWYFFYVL